MGVGVNLVDRVNGWVVQRMAHIRNEWTRAMPAEQRRPQALAMEFSDRLAQTGRFGGEDMDVDAARRLAITSSWVYSDIDLIAGRIAGKAARPQVKRRVDEKIEDIGNHAFERLLARPNPLMPGSFLLRYTAWWLLLTGNAYVFVSSPYVGRGEPVELWPLVAGDMDPRPETLRGTVWGEGQTIDYEYRVNGQPTMLPGENVLHFRLANPFDFWRGLSPLTAAFRAVQSDYNLATWTRDFFGQDNAVPTAVISLRETIGEADFLRARDEIREEFGGRRRTAITRAGDFTVQTIQQTLQEMQVVEGRTFSRAEIDRVYGVPEGLTSGALSGDSRLAAETVLAGNTVQPLADYMAEVWSGLVGRFYDADLVAEAPNLVPRDRAIEIQEYQYYGQDRTTNENRKELNLEPIAHPLADVPVRLLQYWSASAPADAQLPAGVPSMSGADAPVNVQVQEALRSLNGHAPAAAALGLRDELRRWQRVALREVKAGRDAGERPFESDVLPPAIIKQIARALDGLDDEEAVRRVFAAWRNDGIANVRPAAKAESEEDPLEDAKMRAEIDLRRAFRQGHQDLGAVERLQNGGSPENAFGQAWLADYEENLAQEMRPAMLRLSADASRLVSQLLNVSFDLVNAGAQAWANQYSYELISGLTETTQTQLQATISNWIASGEPMHDLVASLRTVFDNPVRAELVASTEVTRIYQQANELSWRQANQELDAGIVGGSWNTASDELVCEICGPLAGATRSLDSPGYLHPDTGELFIMPAHPKCRCWERPVLSKRNNAEGQRSPQRQGI